MPGVSTPAYRYTATPLLRERCDYMYSPFEGAELLRAYEASREQWCGQLARRCAEIVERAPGGAASAPDACACELLSLLRPGALAEAAASWAARAGLPASRLRQRRPLLQPSQEVLTVELLLDLLRACLPDAAESLRGWARERTDRLVKAFEVSKRFYQTYTPSFAPAAGGFLELLPYALAALVFILHYERHAHLPYLNAALKVNDTLASMDTSGEGLLTWASGLVAAERERSAVLALALRHGVS
jgi:hypothetical protein